MNLNTQYVDAFGNITDESGNRYVIKLGSNHYAITFNGELGYLLLSGTTITDIILECEADENNRAKLIGDGGLVVIVNENRSYAIVVDGYTVTGFIELD